MQWLNEPASWQRTGDVLRVSVDPGTVVKPGATYRIFNGQDPFGAPVASGTYAGTPIVIPMTGWASAAPVGLSTPATTAPEFNAFVLVTP